MKHFPEDKEISSQKSLQLVTRTKIDEHVENNYEAGTPDDRKTPLVSHLCLNSWQSRYNVNLQTEEELRRMLEEIRQILEEANTLMPQGSDYFDEDLKVSVEVITTDTRDQHDGYKQLGTISESVPDLAPLSDKQYPLPALKISVDFDR